ncbi:L-rhamnose mutarotase [Pokkaliibacter sp. MBI-7]|uniref:L-rhamnose mutarotase n=1 Tax=Pokkaliibacter sp. MBI-7 TaxID=3040600 RepID=UPI002449E363|nr:L-rhamnose mutarotase [Pokkaliibacter sp. MBI-7]MDH2433426.1 L-rhamnose mutarotase [Pokkaliibacter sp. MBI-7]
MRYASVMQLFPGCAAEYRQRHDAIWPELVALLQGYGIGDYHIWLEDESGRLFASFEASAELDTAALKQEPVMQRWWAMMADIMQTQPGSNEPWARALQPMFYLA